MRSKKDVLRWLEENRQKFIQISDQIWEFAEPAWKEFKSSKLQADFLAAEGFDITWDLAGINTAFVAQWGEGKPVLAFAGEFDALKGLSQKKGPIKEPLVDGACGHGCGHNLLGTGCLAAAVAVKQWLQAKKKSATIRYYGCPAEEGGSAKAFMARAGIFDDVDAAFNFHPNIANFASKGSAVGVNHIRFRFHGRAAHAGGSPHLGRSALDAVELMNIGVNYLREHVTSNVRIHYAITHGGDLPNIVPPEAEVWYYVRAHKPEELEEVTNRVRKIAEGAAMMTETTWTEIFESASSSVLSNYHLADLQYKAMEIIGPIQYTDEEKEYARRINQAYPTENVKTVFDSIKSTNPKLLTLVDRARGMDIIEGNFPSLDEGEIDTGSTDVGDLSQVTPLSMLYTACWPVGAAGHSWGVVSSSASSIGHKGMLHAAKIMALAAIFCIEDPHHLRIARQEFLKSTENQPYKCAIPKHVKPPQFENTERP